MKTKLNMVSNNVSFFYLAGAIIGGFTFVAISIVYLYGFIFLVNPSIIEESIILSILTGSWGTFLFFCLSFTIGLLLSNYSVTKFYYKAKKSNKYLAFKRELSEITEVEIPHSDDKSQITYFGQLKTLTAFANNLGHPQKLYDFAGRARLIGSATLNFIWLGILSLLFIVFLLFGKQYIHKDVVDDHSNSFLLILCIVFIVDLFFIRLSFRETIGIWQGYLKRIDFFSIYHFKDGEIIETTALKERIEKLNKKHSIVDGETTPIPK